MKQKSKKTHNYKILKTYTIEEIKSKGNVDFFLDDEILDKKIKLRRAKVYNKLGCKCVEPGCELYDYHYGLGEDAGGGIHLDMYAYDIEGDLVMITVDHIIPKSKGGKNHISNYQSLCKIHNEIKSNIHNFNRNFVDIDKIYPKGKELISQNYKIYRRIITADEVETIKRGDSSLVKDYVDSLVVGKEYLILEKRDEGVMMSNHPSEIITNKHFIDHAFGDVIIFGLGIGMIIFPLLNDKNIKSITIVEKDAGLIGLVGDIILQHDKYNKVKIIEGDAFEYYKNLGVGKDRTFFDTIYFDIWIKVRKKQINEMEKLHRLYTKFKRGDVSYLTSWLYDIKEKIIERD